MNEQGFGFRGGYIVGFEIGDKCVEFGGIFAFDEDPAGSEAVFEGVLAGCGFAGLSARTAFGLIFCVKSLAHSGFPV
jgi:hypothetical protein